MQGWRADTKGWEMSEIGVHDVRFTKNQKLKEKKKEKQKTKKQKQGKVV